MTEHRYILQSYAGIKSRFHCPECRHRNKTFTRYIDKETDSYLADHVGRCDREDRCGYHYTPRQYFAENPGDVRVQPVKVSLAMPAKDNFDHLPVSLLNASMIEKAYINNNFIHFLAEIFTWDKVMQTAECYKVGTSRHWHGATVFWQLDTKGLVRTGKIMLFNIDTCKRVKEPFNHVTWAHKVVGSKQLAASSGQLAVASGEELAVGGSGQLTVGSLQTQTANCLLPTANFPQTAHCLLPTANFPQTAHCLLPTANFPQTAHCLLPTANFHLQQCFFGEHLLSENTEALVGITESEKTAFMASIMMPDILWLAAGSLNGLDADKCRVLKNRKVLLFPDVGAYTNWKACARSLNYKVPSATFSVHDEMERTATAEERATGADMADRWIGEWLGK
ncbi:MAG: DUF6371 domain-containing protein [Sphingobacteriales bacterium]